MPMPTTTTHGPWTDGTARPTQKGAVAYAKGDRLTIEDEYTVTMGRGERPLGFVINAADGSTYPATVAGIPGRGAPHPDYPCFTCVSVRWTQPDRESLVWTAVAAYSYVPSKSSSTALTGNVRSVAFSHNSVTVPLTMHDGAALTTSAGELLNPTPMAELSSPVIDIAMVLSRPPSQMQGYLGAVNSRDVTVCGIRFPKYTARLLFSARQIEPEEEQNEGVSVLGDRYLYEFRIEGNFTPAPGAPGDSRFSSLGEKDGRKIAGWIQVVPDAGYVYLDEAGTRRRAKVAAAEDPSVQTDSPMPVFLTSAGRIATDESQYHYFLVRPYPEADFTEIGFPSAC